MRDSDALDCSVMERVARHAPVSFEELQRLLKDYTWNQLFAAADRLSRNGSLLIRRIDRCTDLISPGPRFLTEAIGNHAAHAPFPARRQS